MQRRIADIIETYSAQGIHRTGTVVDNESAQWLARQLSSAGAEVSIDTFNFERVAIRDARVEIGGHVIEGVPLFDCSYTDAAGIEGTAGELGSDADIGIAMTFPFGGTDVFRELMQARRASRHSAIVLVTDERMPPDGAAVFNAEHFKDPFGPPVLQVGNRQWPAIKKAMAAGEAARVIVHCDYQPAVAKNVQARIEGQDPALPPVVVMTPRSGWWRCASERGGGIAAFIEIARAIKSSGTRRTVLFTANTGHELGHTGLDHYLHDNPTLINDAHLWVHLGANFAAKTESNVRLQYSDSDARSLLNRHGTTYGVTPNAETPTDERPLGEARNIYDGGGRYVSILGFNGLFHHPADTWPDAVDLELATLWSKVMVDVVLEASDTS